MENLHPIKQLINNANLLISNNRNLIKSNSDYLDLIEKLHQREEKMLVCFGKLYKYMISKNDKTLEEQSYINELFNLITHLEKNEE